MALKYILFGADLNSNFSFLSLSLWVSLLGGSREHRQDAFCGADEPSARHRSGFGCQLEQTLYDATAAQHSLHIDT
jgi:hypothetical protein